MEMELQMMKHTNLAQQHFRNRPKAEFTANRPSVDRSAVSSLNIRPLENAFV
jgi:hypothetical protein